MKGLDNLKTGVRLFAGFALITLLLLFIAYVGYSNNNAINEDLSSMYHDQLLPIQNLSIAQYDLDQINSSLHHMILFPKERSSAEASVQNSIASVSQHMSDYRKLNLTVEEKSELARFDQAWQNYQSSLAGAMNQIKTGDKTAVSDGLADGGEISLYNRTATNSIQKLIAAGIQVAKIQDDHGDLQYLESRNTLAIASLVGVLLAAGLGILVSRSITRPLAVVKRTIQAVAEGERLSFGHLSNPAFASEISQIDLLPH